MSGKAGEINGWFCDDCRRITLTIHVDEGVTPMFLACRADGLAPDENPCKGRGSSMMYPAPPLPDRHRAALIEHGWEWYRPEGAPASLDDLDLDLHRRAARRKLPNASKPKRTEYSRLDEALREHVDKGGLLLRRITDAGLELAKAAA